MILFESILDGIVDIRSHLGRTLLQLLGVILGVGSIVATFALAAAGKAESKRFYQESGGIAKIIIRNKPTGKVTVDARAAASKGLTYSDVLAIKHSAREIDLVSPVVSGQLMVRYRGAEKSRDIMGITPAYAPMNDFKVAKGRFLTDTDIAEAARVVVFGSDRAVQTFSTDDPSGS